MGMAFRMEQTRGMHEVDTGCLVAGEMQGKLNRQDVIFCGSEAI